MYFNLKEVVILGVSFQCHSKYSVHVKNKLIKANRCLYILGSLRKEGYSQSVSQSVSLTVRHSVSRSVGQLVDWSVRNRPLI